MTGSRNFQTDDFSLGPMRIYPASSAISRPPDHDKRQRVEPTPMRVLVALAERAGHIVSREELRECVWQRQYVSEEVINVAVGQMRKALGDDAKNPSYIQTVPGKGYRLVCRPEAIKPDVPKDLSWLRLPAAAVLVLVAVIGLSLFDGPFFGGDPGGQAVPDWRTDMLDHQEARLQQLVELIPNIEERGKYLEARFVVFHGDFAHLPEARALLSGYLERFPDDAEVIVSNAQGYIRRFDSGYFDLSLLESAFELSARAVQIDRYSGAARAQHGRLLRDLFWDMEGAGEAYRMAVELALGDADLRRQYAMFLVSRGEFDAARATLEPVLLGDREAIAKSDIARIHYVERNYGAALLELDRLERVRWDIGDVHRLRSNVYAAMGDKEKSFEYLLMHLEARAYDKTIVDKLQTIYEEGGLEGVGNFFADLYVDRFESGAPMSPVAVAIELIKAGRPEDALLYLEKGLDARDPALLKIGVDPVFDPLKELGGFQRLIAATEIGHSPPEKAAVLAGARNPGGQ